ncbi:Pelota-like protein [Meloidogyne graminicola]|uniref:Protein pelota homolog n=1 Tax=Meloidogyne graminicola TaxID=189291 RepID=A0A8S9ZS28_9BILA|nr:Pelota-like protein [Meloidogyne graminicola]
MKILKRGLQKDTSGFVRLICEEEEDMWHVYNLVRIGDVVRSSTMRKITNETSTGSKTSQRVQMTLTICVETIDFDATVCSLHLKGKNIQENQHVRLGAYHTLDLALNRVFTLEKQCWDAVDLHRLELCSDVSNKADVAGIVMHEGLANICLISSSMTIVKSKIDMQIARKRKGFAQQHEKSLNSFFNAIAVAFIRHVNLEQIKCVIVASPGFLREQFMEFFWQYVEKEGLRQSIFPHKSKFILVHSSSGFKHSLNEVLSDCTIGQRLSETKAQAEVKALNTFLELMSTDPQRAVYGYKHVIYARDQQSIETLMVSDSLFRSRDITQRRKYVQLVESIKEQGSNVLIFSSMHATGEQLTQLTGVAAILRFPIADLDDDEFWEEDYEQKEIFEENGRN